MNLALARKHISDKIDSGELTQKDWPEDDWTQLDENTDLNLWQDEETFECKAAVYPVKKVAGFYSTDTNKPHELKVEFAS